LRISGFEGKKCSRSGGDREEQFLTLHLRMKEFLLGLLTWCTTSFVSKS